MESRGGVEGEAIELKEPGFLPILGPRLIRRRLTISPCLVNVENVPHLLTLAATIPLV